MNDVLRYCEKHGRKYSRTAIYNAGKKYGFAVKIDGNPSLQFDKEKFLDWFNNGREEVPNGFITVSEMRKKYNLTLNFSYSVANDPDCKTKRIGAGKGIIYVDTNGLEEIIEKHRNKGKYDWNN